MKVGLLIIATNKYKVFLNRLVVSADKYFMPENDATYFIFTDEENTDIKSTRNLEIIKVEHRSWPWMTLGRYKIFTDNSEKIKEMDYVFYIDVDMLFVGRVDDSILSDRVATQHPGFAGQRGTPDNNPKSLAFVSEDENMQYFAGGFNGGSAQEFLKMAQLLSKNIEIDYSRGIVALWHDESHLNRYFIDNPPTKILNHSYCCVEGSRDFIGDRKILALVKDKNYRD